MSIKTQIVHVSRPDEEFSYTLGDSKMVVSVQEVRDVLEELGHGHNNITTVGLREFTLSLSVNTSPDIEHVVIVPDGQTSKRHLIVPITLSEFISRASRMSQSPAVEWISTGTALSESNPAGRLPDVIAEFGQPDIIDPLVGGCAVWKKHPRISPWHRIIIMDEQIPHDRPGPHNDFLYAHYPLDVPSEMIPSVLALSKSVVYDPLKKEIRARCHFMGANVATVFLAAMIVDGEMTGEEARNGYGSAIFSTINGHKDYDARAYPAMVLYLTNRL